MSQKGNIVCVVWHDKRDVRVISSNSQPRFTTVPRRVKGRVQEIECPESVVQYNKHMGGVDLADQNRSYYSVGRDPKKFWKSLQWYILNTAIVNSYILFKQSLPRPLTRDQVNLTQLKYRLSLVDQLVCGFSNRKRLGQQAESIIVDEDIIGHELVKTGKKLVCRNCSQLDRNTVGGVRGVQSTFKCKLCNIWLCRDGCHVEYHLRHSIDL